MSEKVQSLDAWRDAMHARSFATADFASPALNSGGGGGTSDGMEARISRLETQFEKLDSKVDELRIDMAVLKERVGNLPGKGFIVTATVSGLAFFGALNLFQKQIADLLISQ